MRDTVRIEFEPAGRRIAVAPGTTLLAAARRAGIGIASICGGDGSCGRCRVMVIDGVTGAPDAAERRALSPAELASGERLACRVPADAAMRIHVPRASLISNQRLQSDGPAVVTEVDPAVRAHLVVVAPPEAHDQRSDFDRIAEAAAATHGIGRLRAAPGVLGQLAGPAREARREVTIFVRDDEVVGLVPAGRHALGVAVDLGTTKIAGYLADLETGRGLASDALMNPQVAYGEDIISRLAHASRGEREARDLARCVREALHNLVGALCERAGVARDDVAEGCVVANTAMHHLLLGLPTGQLARAPFAAATSAPLEVRAAEIGIRMAPGALVYLPPVIGGFVGADHVAMILGAGLDRAEVVTVGVDIGTNTEIVIRRPDLPHLTAASCASGPAFEGAHIRDGMRAASGAIEAVRLPDGDGPAEIRTIDEEPAVGICGSGIVDAVAELRRTGRIDHRGRFRAGAPGVRENERGKELVLAAGDQARGRREIVVTQEDIDEVGLAKGAIAAGISILLEATGTDPAAVDEVVIAGAFGSFLNLSSAIGIGLLPDLPNANHVQVGNAAGAGARALLLSRRERARAEMIARTTEYLELTAVPGFKPRFARAMHFPQSDVPRRIP